MNFRTLTKVLGFSVVYFRLGKGRQVALPEGMIGMRSISTENKHRTVVFKTHFFYFFIEKYSSTQVLCVQQTINDAIPFFGTIQLLARCWAHK